MAAAARGAAAARLVHRGLLDAAPRRLVVVTAVAAGLTVLTLVAGALLADASGRHITWSSGPYSGRASPFPGLFYGLPAAVGLGVLGLLTGAVLWIVANRVALFVSGGLLLVGGDAVRSVASSGVAPLLAPAGVCTAVLGIVAMLAGVIVSCLPAPWVPADAPAVPVP